MASVTFRGKAAIEGVAGAIDVVVYPTAQTLKGTQQYDEEIIKDEHGFDVSWVSRNEHMMLEIGLKFLGDTAAHAAIPMQNSGSQVSTLGQPFLKPYQTMVLSGFALAALNGTYQNITGTTMDFANTKVADGDYKLRRYADSTQNTGATTAPS